MSRTVNSIDVESLSQKVLTMVESKETAAISAATVASATYAKLLETAITLSAGEALLLDFSACGSSNSALTADWIYFDVTINGAVWRSVGVVMLLNNSPTNASLIGRVAVGSSGLVVGANTLQVRWRRGNGAGTTKIDPAVEGHHAVLRLARVQA